MKLQAGHGLVLVTIGWPDDRTGGPNYIAENAANHIPNGSFIATFADENGRAIVPVFGAQLLC